VAFVVMIALLQQLEEPQAVSLENLLSEVFVQSPQRLWLWLWPD
jgi:hypothetical protein